MTMKKRIYKGRALFFLMGSLLLLLFLAAGWGLYLFLRWAFLQNFLFGLFIVFFVLPALGRLFFLGLMLSSPFLMTLFFNQGEAPGEDSDKGEDVIDVKGDVIS